MDNYDKLIDLISVLNNITDYEEMLRLSLEKISGQLTADVISILMLNPRTHDSIKTVIHEENITVSARYHYINSSLSGWVIKNKQILVSNELQSDKRFRENLFAETTFTKCLCVPVVSSGIITGTVIALRKDGSISFTEENVSELQNLVSILSPYIYKTRKIQEYFISPLLSDETLINKYSSLGLVGRSLKFIELLRAVESAANCDVRVLLEGETGTGKELIARAVHSLSKRSGNRMITLDCGAIPQNLIESELFGHLKGSFTGAVSDRKGLLTEADKGTLFIDEISLLPLELQSRFLRFIQEGEFRQVGSDEIKSVDVRIVAASSSSLLKQVNEGNFREELYYRLCVYPIKIPTLNQRSDDIPILVNLFVKKFADDQNKDAETVDEDIMYLLLNRHWRGNIRELENFCERIVTLIPSGITIIGADYLPGENKKELKKLKSAAGSSESLKPLDKSLEEYEEQIIRIALIRHNWNQSKAAESIGIKEQTLRYKMKKLSIIPPA